MHSHPEANPMLAPKKDPPPRREPPPRKPPPERSTYEDPTPARAPDEEPSREPEPQAPEWPPEFGPNTVLERHCASEQSTAAGGRLWRSGLVTAR